MIRRVSREWRTSAVKKTLSAVPHRLSLILPGNFHHHIHAGDIFQPLGEVWNRHGGGLIHPIRKLHEWPAHPISWAGRSSASADHLRPAPGLILPTAYAEAMTVLRQPIV